MAGTSSSRCLTDNPLAADRGVNNDFCVSDPSRNRVICDVRNGIRVAGVA